MDDVCTVIDPFLGIIDFFLSFASSFTGFFGVSLPTFTELVGDILGCI